MLSTSSTKSKRSDRGARIRSFRELGSVGTSAPRDNQAQNTPLFDINGERYAQAIKKFERFSTQHKDGVNKERRKLDWTEEDANLRRSRQELEKALQGTIRRPPFRVDSTTTRTRNDPTTFVERDNHSVLCSQEGPDFIGMHAGEATKHPNGAYSGIHYRLTTSADNDAPEGDADQTHSSGELMTLDELWEEEKQLESARQMDMESDLSHMFALKTIVANFMLSSESSGKSDIPRHSSQLASVNSELRPSLARCAPVEDMEKVTPIVVSSVGPEVDERGLSGSIEAAGMNIENSRQETARSKAGIVADILIQAHTMQLRVSEHLADLVSTLEKEIRGCSQTLALALAGDVADHSAGEAQILEKVGLCPRVRDGNRNHEDRVDHEIYRDEVHEAIVRADVLDSLRRLKEEHAARLALLREEFLRDAAGPNAAGSVEAALDETGGWSSAQHFRFTKVLKAASGAFTGAIKCGGIVNSCGTRREGGALTERLRTELPGVPLTALRRHGTWHRMRCLYTAKKRAESEKHRQALDELAALSKTSLDAMRKDTQASAAVAKERAERERRREELDKILRGQQEIRDQRDHEEQRRIEKEERERGVKETAKAARRAAQAQRNRTALEKYREGLLQLRAREAEAREAENKAAEAERVQRMSKNLARIGFREEKARQKRKDQERREREAEALEQTRLKVLLALAASVPYADACANAESRLSHVTGTGGTKEVHRLHLEPKTLESTADAAAAAHFGQFSEADRARGHCPMFGYDSRKILRDARFRLGIYLHEAGVANTPAAHAAVMGAVGPRAEAPF